VLTVRPSLRGKGHHRRGLPGGALGGRRWVSLGFQKTAAAISSSRPSGCWPRSGTRTGRARGPRTEASPGLARIQRPGRCSACGLALPPQLPERMLRLEPPGRPPLRDTVPDSRPAAELSAGCCYRQSSSVGRRGRHRPWLRAGQETVARTAADHQLGTDGSGHYIAPDRPGGDTNTCPRYPSRRAGGGQDIRRSPPVACLFTSSGSGRRRGRSSWSPFRLGDTAP
jgi:hypothetical protein